MPYTPPAQVIRFCRETKGWKQRDLAERFGTTQVQVSRWESGASLMPPELWAQIEPELALGRQRADEHRLNYVFATRTTPTGPGLGMVFLYDQPGRIARIIGDESGGWAQSVAASLEQHGFHLPCAIPMWRGGMNNLLRTIPSSLPPGEQRVRTINPPGLSGVEVSERALAFLHDVLKYVAKSPAQLNHFGVVLR